RFVCALRSVGTRSVPIPPGPNDQARPRPFPCGHWFRSAATGCFAASVGYGRLRHGALPVCCRHGPGSVAGVVRPGAARPSVWVAAGLARSADALLPELRGPWPLAAACGGGPIL